MGLTASWSGNREASKAAPFSRLLLSSAARCPGVSLVLSLPLAVFIIKVTAVKMCNMKE